jgi:hypothetical protein
MQREQSACWLEVLRLCSWGWWRLIVCHMDRETTGWTQTVPTARRIWTTEVQWHTSVPTGVDVEERMADMLGFLYRTEGVRDATASADFDSGTISASLVFDAAQPAEGVPHARALCEAAARFAGFSEARITSLQVRDARS